MATTAAPASAPSFRFARLRSHGGRDALAEAFRRHHAELYRYCRSIVRDDDDAQDALQSTFAKAVAALEDERRDFELRPWLFRIAHNEAITIIRRRRGTDELDDVAAVGADSLSDVVALREELRVLQRDLADLPERQRAALLLRELSGLGHAEIATVLDTSPRLVKQTIFEARTALHECRAGRSLACEEVQRVLSDADRRRIRSRRMRAHMRGCRECSAFSLALAERPRQLSALAGSMPMAIAALFGGAAAGGGAVGGSVAAGGGLLGALSGHAAVVALTAVVATGGTGAVLAETGVLSSSPPSFDTPARSEAPATLAPSTPAALPARARPGVLRSAAPAVPSATERATPPATAHGGVRPRPARSGASAPAPTTFAPTTTSSAPSHRSSGGSTSTSAPAGAERGTPAPAANRPAAGDGTGNADKPSKDKPANEPTPPAQSNAGGNGNGNGPGTSSAGGNGSSGATGNASANATGNGNGTANGNGNGPPAHANAGGNGNGNGNGQQAATPAPAASSDSGSSAASTPAAAATPGPPPHANAGGNGNGNGKPSGKPGN